MKFEVLYTSNFERKLKPLIKKYRSLKNDLANFITLLEKNPDQGVPLGKNCYKIRLAISSKGKGKSGGARIITHVYVEGNKVYLLSIFDKSGKDSITDNELKNLLKFIE